MTLRAPLAGAALAVVLAACGPYAEVGQKLDVTSPIAGGETWIAASGTEIRLLVLGPAAEGGAPFAFSALEMPISAGTSASTLQGTWTAGADAATLQVRLQYTLPDERGTSLLRRRGAYREDVHRTVALTATRDGTRLVLGGDPALSGTYLLLRDALGRLAAATGRDAACAFQIANLGIRTSEVRIIGFGGPGMTQYQTSATYGGTLAGALRVSEEGFLDNTTTISYAGFEDVGGVVVDGEQITDANSSGDGHMAGTMSFALTPLAADGTAGAPVTGRIDFGGAGVPSDAVQISNGNANGGVYVVTLDGGGAARVSPIEPPSPSVAECLALP